MDQLKLSKPKTRLRTWQKAMPEKLIFRRSIEKLQEASEGFGAPFLQK